MAIDPGERVGWAFGRIDGAELRLLDHGIMALKDFALWLYNGVHVNGAVDTIVFETFRPRPRESAAGAFVGSELPVVQLIGMIRLIAWVSNVKLVPQGPDAKTTALLSLKNDLPSAQPIRDALARMPKTHDDAHDGDAIMHLWTYYFKEHA